jgi:biotin carboxylase
MRSTLLIVAAGPLQLPAITEARVAGLRTVAVDANPAAPGISLADHGVVLDIHDHAAVIDVAKREAVSGVITLCTDTPVNTVAAVAQALGLTALTPEAAQCATDKRLMRKSFAEHGAPSPRFLEIEDESEALDAAEEIGYPVALKIARSSGSRGIYRVDNANELHRSVEAARRHQSQGALLVEEWLEGPEVSVEGMCFEGQVHVIQITDKCVFPGAFPVESGHTQPSRLAADLQTRIRDCATAGIRALGLMDCAFHVEIKATSRGPMLIEVGARLGGDRISTHLTPLSMGVNLVRAAVELAVGRKPDVTPRLRRGAAIRYFDAGRSGNLESIAGIDEIETMPGLELLFAESERDGALGPGFRIQPIRSSQDRYGHVIFSGEEAQEAADRAERAARAMIFRFATE